MVCCLLTQENVEGLSRDGKHVRETLDNHSFPRDFVINKGAVYIRLKRFTPKGTFLRLPCQRQGASDQAGREHAIGKGESNFPIEERNIT
jgi:hypothetical protein